MVKLQPSKLAMRVRFPLPAPSFEINDLRKNLFRDLRFPNTFSYGIQHRRQVSMTVKDRRSGGCRRDLLRDTPIKARRKRRERLSVEVNL